MHRLYKKNLACFAYENPRAAALLSSLGELPVHPVKTSLGAALPDLKERDLLIAIGLGKGGIYSEALGWLKADRKRRLLFLERDLYRIGSFLQDPSSTPLIRDRQVHLKMLESERADDPALEWLGWSFFDSKAAVVCNPEAGIGPELFKRIREAVLYQLAVKKDFLDEYLKFGIAYYKNFYANALELPRSHLGDALFGRFKGLPAIICGAGPSLQKQLPLLKLLRDRALLFAGGSALNALAAGGVEPHFGVGIDPNPSQYSRFSALKGRKLPCFYRGRLHHAALAAIEGPRLYLTGGGGYDTARWLEGKLGLESSELDEGHNVVNFTLQLAALLGCNPLILVGVDLAYTDSLLYAEGVVEQASLTQEQLASEELLERRGLFGKPVLTLPKWLAESDWIARFARSYPELKLLNATEGGLGIEGVEPLPLEEVSKRFLRASLPIAERAALEIERAGLLPVSRKEVESSLCELRESLKRCLALFERLEKELPRASEVSWPSPFAALYESDLEEEEAFEAVLAMFATVYSYVQAPRFAAFNSPKSGLSKKEKKRKRFLLFREKALFLKRAALVNLMLLERALDG